MNKLLLSFMFITAVSCSTATMKKKEITPEQKTIINSNTEGKGAVITIEFTKGESFNYPLMAAWLEDADGKYIQTLYVPTTIATGVFKYGRQEKNKWITSPKRAPQTLPFWAHKRGIRAADGLFMPDEKSAVPDAYTGATPKTGFILSSRADNPLPGKFRVMLEINQNWDWNEYWTNDRYPDDENYKWSCQPALVYQAEIDMQSLKDSYSMKPIGHSHYSGKTGELFSDLSTLTTALRIADSIIVKFK